MAVSTVFILFKDELSMKVIHALWGPTYSVGAHKDSRLWFVSILIQDQGVRVYVTLQGCIIGCLGQMHGCQVSNISRPNFRKVWLPGV